VIPATVGIDGCAIVPVTANRDERGCLYEVFRQSWPGAFPTVQWNVCSSCARVVRGVHVHVDFDEFYTLPRGRVIIGLADIRRDSPSFGKSAQFEWNDHDDVAVSVPRGVAHVVYFKEDSVLAFGLSGPWSARFDNVGCQWDDPQLGFDWGGLSASRSERDVSSGSYQEMLAQFESMAALWRDSLSAEGRPG
jgi:dTDP-4-dehydrorhamnose 3,5-epimerase